MYEKLNTRHCIAVDYIVPTRVFKVDMTAGVGNFFA